MRVLQTILAAVAAGAVLGPAAQAAVIVPLSIGPFSMPVDPAGVIPAGTFLQGTNTYDFTFTTTSAIYDTLMQMQATTVSSGHAHTIAFTLFKGAPGVGTFVANSGGTSVAPTLLTLENGTYYMQVTTLNVPRELVTGGVTLLSAIPEPAGWALMLLGVGALGVAARGRRRAGLAADA